MPPSGEPIQELILQDIETAMKLIVGGAEYYTAVNAEAVERREVGTVLVPSFPAHLHRGREDRV